MKSRRWACVARSEGPEGVNLMMRFRCSMSTSPLKQRLSIACRASMDVLNMHYWTRETSLHTSHLTAAINLSTVKAILAPSSST